MRCPLEAQPPNPCARIPRINYSELVRTCGGRRLTPDTQGRGGGAPHIKSQSTFVLFFTFCEQLDSFCEQSLLFSGPAALTTESDGGLDRWHGICSGQEAQAVASCAAAVPHRRSGQKLRHPGFLQAAAPQANSYAPSWPAHQKACGPRPAAVAPVIAALLQPIAASSPQQPSLPHTCFQLTARHARCG